MIILSLGDGMNKQPIATELVQNRHVDKWNTLIKELLSKIYKELKKTEH